MPAACQACRSHRQNSCKVERLPLFLLHLNGFQKEKPGWKDNIRNFLANLWDFPSVETYVLSKRKSMGIKKPFVKFESTGGMQFLKKLVYAEFRTNIVRERQNTILSFGIVIEKWPYIPKPEESEARNRTIDLERHKRRSIKLYLACSHAINTVKCQCRMAKMLAVM